MVFKKSIRYRFLLTILLSCIAQFSFAQNNAEKQVTLVFNQLLSVYGSSKTTPKIVLIKKINSTVLPARYNSEASSIEIDLALYELCRGFGKDSLNAISIVLSHELTHYYNDHLFCSDYAWVNLKNSNLELARKMRDVSLSSRKEKEIEADIKGFFFALAGGYKIQGLHDKLIRAIYKKYNLGDTQKGYPTKFERIALALSAEKEASNLYGYFENGLKYLSQKKYDQAIVSFEIANSKIPFKENFNNIGVSKTLKALDLKPISASESIMPKRFLYPIEIDNTSRLKRDISRGNESDIDQMGFLLLSAKNDFEKSISLDPLYGISHINLACVYDLMGKHLSAIAEIAEKLPKESFNTIGAQRILAISYYNADMEGKAEEIWEKLKL